MFMVVAKNGQPYAQVFTSVTPARFLAALPEKLESHLAVFDSWGQVLALPVMTDIGAKKIEAMVIVIVAASLIGMLLAMYRFWNYRILTRTYEQACRAVEDDLPPHLPAVPAAYVRDLVRQLGDDLTVLEDIRLSRDAAKLRRWAHRITSGLSVLGPSMLYD
jgi:hypothetical protein